MTSMRDVPFHTQDWNLDDWRALGFGSREAAEYWQAAGQGALSVKMAVEGVTGKETERVADIIAHGTRLGVYTHTGGWTQRGLVLLSHILGASGVVLQPLSEDDIKKHLDAGDLCIVSVEPSLLPRPSWFQQLFSRRKEGRPQVTLLLGYDEHGFYTHHTSERPEHNWENHHVPFSTFAKTFGGKGVIITGRTVTH